MGSDQHEFTRKVFRLMAEQVADRYIISNLKDVDVRRMMEDKTYAQVMFYKKWAFERFGAPKRFKVIAMKCALSRSWPVLSKYLKNDRRLNKKNNPLFEEGSDKSGYVFRKNAPDISKIVRKINSKRPESLKEAFSDLSMPGVSHKIKTFFLRDVFFLLNRKPTSIEQGLYLFPVDIWIKKFLENIDLPDSDINQKIKKRDYQGIQELGLARKAVDFCLKEGISSLRLNMGIWKYCSECIQSEEYLRKLLKAKKISSVRKEFVLLKNYI